MRYYLIDFENTGSQGLSGIDKLRKSDRVIVFYSPNVAKITVEEMRMVVESKASVEFVELKSLGHNALDFNLVMYLGTVIGSFRGKNLEINIISKDTGYNTLKTNPLLEQYSFSVKINRKSTIIECLPRYKKELTKIRKEIITETLSAISLEDYCECTYEAIEAAKNKAELHSILFSKYGQNGADIYRTIRPKFEELKD